MDTVLIPPSGRYDRASRTLTLDPRDPAFVADPYATYAALHEVAPVFLWREYGHWCFAGHERVSALLRDRRLGRQLLHRMTRAELGWAEPPAHLAPFTAYWLVTQLSVSLVGFVCTALIAVATMVMIPELRDSRAAAAAAAAAID